MRNSIQLAVGKSPGSADGREFTVSYGTQQALCSVCLLQLYELFAASGWLKEVNSIHVYAYGGQTGRIQ